jgi:transposase
MVLAAIAPLAATAGNQYQEKQQIKKWVRQNPKNLKQVIEKIREEWGVVTSKDTVKKILKCLGMRCGNDFF